MKKNSSIQLSYNHPFIELPNTVIIQIKGDLPSGSLGNSLVRQWELYIQKNSTEKFLTSNYILFDFLELNYIYGDNIAGFIVMVMSKNRKAKIVVIAQGDTKKNLEPLLAHSLAVLLVASYAEIHENLK